MSYGRIIAFALYLLVMLTGSLFAMVYLFRKGFMPYHSEVVNTPWNKVEQRFQLLIIALIRTTGGGALTSAVAIAFLLFIPFRNGELWANWAILAVGLSETIPVFIATCSLKRKTSASSPWQIMMLLIIFLIIAFVLGLIFVK